MRPWIYLFVVLLVGLTGGVSRELLWPVPVVDLPRNFNLEPFFSIPLKKEFPPGKPSNTHWNWVFLRKGTADFSSILRVLSKEINPDFYRKIILIQGGNRPRHPKHLRWRLGTQLEETRIDQIPGVHPDPQFFQTEPWGWGFILAKALSPKADYIPLSMPTEHFFGILAPDTLVIDLRNSHLDFAPEWEDFFQSYHQKAWESPNKLIMAQGLKAHFFQQNSSLPPKKVQAYFLSPLAKSDPFWTEQKLGNLSIPIYTQEDPLPQEIQWKGNPQAQPDWIYKNKKLTIKSLGKREKISDAKGLILGIIQTGETLEIFPVPISLSPVRN